MKYRLLLLTLLIIYCGDNHIVERAAEDYFPLRADYWWRYASNNDTVLVEVEPADTLLQVECFPVSHNGAVRYVTKSDNAISQYVRKTYNYSGIDYIVLENFIIRIELPLIKGNTYQYYLIDSIYIADQLIRAHYETIGNVVNFTYESEYGDVYEVETITIESLTTPDTAIVDTSTLTEFYAPGVGMVRFIDGTSEYRLIEYSIP